MIEYYIMNRIFPKIEGYVLTGKMFRGVDGHNNTANLLILKLDRL